MADTTAFVDVTCRGLRVAHRARFQPGPDGGGFVEHEAPLPVGTPLVILADGQAPRAACVVAVVEQESGARSAPGMRVAGLAAGVPTAVAGAPTQAVPVAGEPGADVTLRTPMNLDAAPLDGAPADADEGEPAAAGKKGRKGRRRSNGR